MATFNTNILQGGNKKYDDNTSELTAKLGLKHLPIILNGQFYKIADVYPKDNGKIVKCVCQSCPKQRIISATVGSNSNLLSHLMVTIRMY